MPIFIVQNSPPQFFLHPNDPYITSVFFASPKKEITQGQAEANLLSLEANTLRDI
jgi:hypothetical protein